MSGGSRPVNMRTDAGMGEVKRAPGASRMLEWDERMHRWAVVGERGWTLRAEGSGRGRLLSVGQGQSPVPETWLARPDAVEWADTDRLRRSWDPNRYPKLPETGRISADLERTIDPLTP